MQNLQEDELFLIASHRQLFTEAGITPIVSAAEAIELCRDKYVFYQYLKEHGLPVSRFRFATLFIEF